MLLLNSLIETFTWIVLACKHATSAAAELGGVSGEIEPKFLRFTKGGGLRSKPKTGQSWSKPKRLRNRLGLAWVWGLEDRSNRVEIESMEPRPYPERDIMFHRHGRLSGLSELEVFRGTKGVPRKGVWASVNTRVWTRKELRAKHDQTSCYSRPPFLGTPLVPSR